MELTNNLGLKMPGKDDFFNIDDFNYNAEVLDEQFGNMKNKEIGLIASFDVDENKTQFPCVFDLPDLSSFEKIIIKNPDSGDSAIAIIYGDKTTNKFYTDIIVEMFSNGMFIHGGDSFAAYTEIEHLSECRILVSLRNSSDPVTGTVKVYGIKSKES